MEQGIYTVPELKERLRPVFDAYGVRRAVLFGSYGKGCATPKSDVDLWVDSGVDGLAFVGLIEDVRKVLDDKEVDMMDKAHIEPNSRIDREIRRTGVEIYAQ